MKYLCATDYLFYDRPSGSARVATDIAKLVREEGHEVTIVCRTSPDHRPAPTVIGILDEQRRGRGRTRAVSLFLALVCWMECVLARPTGHGQAGNKTDRHG